MSIKARPTILFATATALALSTCGATSSPSTPAASAGSSSAVASTDGSFTLLNGLIPVPTGSRSYSKKGDPLSQTTESDKSLRIEEWTKVSLPNLDGTHEIVKTLRLSPDGTSMALLAPFKMLEDDISYQLYSTPVGGGEATQLTKVTGIAGGKHVILAWRV